MNRLANGLADAGRQLFSLTCRRQLDAVICVSAGRDGARAHTHTYGISFAKRHSLIFHRKACQTTEYLWQRIQNVT